jgi:hypothetical protein
MKPETNIASRLSALLLDSVADRSLPLADRDAFQSKRPMFFRHEQPTQSNLGKTM